MREAQQTPRVRIYDEALRRNRMPRTSGPKIGHVRVCGGSGWVTARFYPAKARKDTKKESTLLPSTANIPKFEEI
jgi:hypothetical protein